MVDRIGVTRQTISSIENDSARPSKTIGIALSAVFKEYQNSAESNPMFNIISESTGWSKAATGLLGGMIMLSITLPAGCYLVNPPSGFLPKDYKPRIILAVAQTDEKNPRRPKPGIFFISSSFI